MTTTLTPTEQQAVKEADNEPVLVVKTKEGKLVHVGRPDGFKGKLLAKYAALGYSISTITIKEFRATDWKWYWEE